jgi:amidophosphoribosyltransferase
LFEINASERPREECGVFAVHNHLGSDTAAYLTYLGLLALQHRGQESAGMAYPGATGLQCRKGMGLVSSIFSREALVNQPARSVIGHVRYSTTGVSSVNNAQPLVARSARGGGIALAHNGNLSNNARLRDELLTAGHIFHATTDSETLLASLFHRRGGGLAEAARHTMSLAQGAYAAVVMDGEQMVAFRDPHGFRPLVMGRLDEAIVFASESCALDTTGAHLIGEVRPGEIVVVDPYGRISSCTPLPRVQESFCVFEFIYFARPDSNFQGKNVHQVRKAIGSCLARRVAPDLDMVIPSPDSGISAAMGLAEAAGLPLEWAVHRNPYQGRTFIKPSQEGRELAARLKYSPISGLVKGKRVAVVDDSLVRGTTARKLSALLREAGATAIHFYISAPPYTHPCYYGIDIPASAELAAAALDPEALAVAVGADSITFAAPDDLYAAVGYNKTGLCTACFTGDYPCRGSSQ